MTLLEQIRYAQEEAVYELRVSATLEGRVPSALEVHQARVNAGELVVMADLERLGLSSAGTAGAAQKSKALPPRAGAEPGEPGPAS